jgi:hypothetical protein
MLKTAFPPPVFMLECRTGIVFNNVDCVNFYLAFPHPVTLSLQVLNVKIYAVDNLGGKGI